MLEYFTYDEILINIPNICILKHHFCDAADIALSRSPVLSIQCYQLGHKSDAYSHVSRSCSRHIIFELSITLGNSAIYTYKNFFVSLISPKYMGNLNDRNILFAADDFMPNLRGNFAYEKGSFFSTRNF